jgi:hypothetical protein
MIRLVLSSGFAAILLAAPAFAQVYKWVDERGVVNYSNEAPANRNSTVLDPKSVRVSTYSTDKAPQQAATTLASASERALSDKIDRLERKLDAERYARSLADAQIQTAADSRYEQCLRDRRVDCDYAGSEPYYYPYYGPVVVAKHHMHPRSVVHRNTMALKAEGRPAFSSARSTAPARQI